MTTDEFRALALSLPEAEADSHFGQSDARLRGKIFASRIADSPAVLKLTPEQQMMVCAAEPQVFAPVEGGWGAKGWTQIFTLEADATTAISALWMAWRNVAPKTLLKQHTTTEF